MMTWRNKVKKLKQAGWKYTKIGHDNFYTHYSNIYFIEDLKNMDDEEFMLVIEEG